MPTTHDFPNCHFRAEAGVRYYVPQDLSIAEVVFGANCGPASLAACLSQEVSDIMRYLPHFEDENRRYTNLTAMKAALKAAAVKFEVMKCTLPSKGLVLVQWTGPWTEKQFFSRWSLLYTHWIAVDGQMFYDLHSKCWLHHEEWTAKVVPFYLADIPQAAGWAIKYGIEVEKSSSAWPGSFLDLLFRRPNRMLSK